MKFDRRIAGLLDKFPRVRSGLKYIYFRVQYIVYKRRRRYVCTHPICGTNGYFGYYDKCPLHRTLLLFHRSTTDNTRIMAWDYNAGEEYFIGETTARNWQQGAMLQWIPNKDAVVYNRIDDFKLVSVIFDFETREELISGLPIQTIHPHQPEALTLNYRRLHRLRAEYGYEENVTNFSPDLPQDQDGVWHFKFGEKEGRLIIRISDLNEIKQRQDMCDAKHKINHIMYSPSGNKFVFMHRWFGKQGKFSRLYVASHPDGKELKILMDDRMVSHYSWRDDDHLIVYGRTGEKGDHYYLINVQTGTWKIIGEGLLDKYGDGHPSYSPDKRWIVTDTYPDKARMRHLLVYDTIEEKVYEVGSFFAPWRFDGSERVDLHPRWNLDGRLVSIDSAHEGVRKTYLIDVSNIVSVA